MSDMPDVPGPAIEVSPELAKMAFAAIGQLPEQGVAAMMTGVVATIMATLVGECSDCPCETCVSLRGHMQGMAAIRQPG